MAEVSRYVTPVFRLSFPALFEAKSYDGSAPKFSGTAVWNPSKFTTNDKKRWKAMRAALDEESKSAFKKKVSELPGNFKKGLRDGAEKADLEGFGEGTIFANLTTMMRPGVIDQDKQPIGPEHGNADDIYPGCYCRATVTTYSYDNKGKGVAFGLMNIQKVADGERLDARTDAAEDFEDDIDDEWLEAAEDDDPLGGDDEDDEIPF